MDSLATVLQGARKGARLPEATMARLLGVDRRTLLHLEGGEVDPSPDVLERYACAFGLSISQLMAGEAARTPMRMLFRSMVAEGRPSVVQLAQTGAHLTLGDFVRCTGKLGALRERLGERRDPPVLGLARPVQVKNDSAPPHRADELAQQIRDKLELGVEPIPSMVELVQERLGIDVFWVGPDELDPTLDAASVLAPGPAILVNLVGGVEQWWRTRMTLAHELCHLLFDRDLLASGMDRGFVLYSPGLSPGGDWDRRPEARRRWYFSEEFERIEQRASAFAAYFLAPPSQVRALTERLDPTSEAAISAIARSHGVGRETAINLLTNVFGLEQHVRTTMLLRPHGAPHDAGSRERFHEPAVIRPGLRSGVLRDLVFRALAAGAIDRAEARDHLAWPLTEPLPEHPSLSDDLRAPLRSPTDRVRLAVDRYLADRKLSDGLRAADVTRDGDGYRVAVVDVLGRDAYEPAGVVWLTARLEVTKDDLRQPRWRAVPYLSV